MQTKSLGRVTVKDETAGTVTALFATYDAVDKDGDVTLKGAFTDGAPVIISAYNHRSWEGALPVGKGVIRDTDEGPTLEGQFFMDTTHGRDAFLTVKALSDDDLQEWSYSLHEVDSDRGATWEGRKVRQIIKGVTVREVSPVIVGAGVNTRTLATKGAKSWNRETAAALRDAGKERYGSDDAWVYAEDYDPEAGVVIYHVTPEGDDPSRLVQLAYVENEDGTVTLGDEESEVVAVTSYAPKGVNQFAELKGDALRAVASLTSEGVERIACRAPEGKSIAEQADALAAVEAAVAPLRKALDVAAATPTESSDAEQEYLRFVALNIERTAV